MNLLALIVSTYLFFTILVESKAFITLSKSDANMSRRTTECKAEKADATTTEKENFKQQTYNPLRLAVLKLGMTELAGTSTLNYGKYDGMFECAFCGQALFDSNAKYDSKSGWPSFWRSVNSESIGYKMEFGNRLECRCKRCSGHLGHVFMDGPKPNSVDKKVLESSPESDPRSKTNTYLPRYCINGAAIRYKKRDQVDK